MKNFSISAFIFGPLWFLFKGAVSEGFFFVALWIGLYVELDTGLFFKSDYLTVTASASLVLLHLWYAAHADIILNESKTCKGENK